MELYPPLIAVVVTGVSEGTPHTSRASPARYACRLSISARVHFPNEGTVDIAFVI